MNKFYIIVPVVLLAVFGGVYWQHSGQAARHAEQQAAEVAHVEQEAAAKKQAAERQAREDAERRSAERLVEERKREEARQAAWEADNRKLAEDTTRYTEQAAKNRTEAERLAAEVKSLEAEHEKQEAAVFAQTEAVELARIAKRNAELEIQRLVEIVARKGGTSLNSPVIPESAVR